ncbi:hypothetical protein [Pleomorphomonas sp. NRK KF1]|uniref:hypothetical protein n=1 Tax=Pleomorphomonas sp. NRK KF1 TaxID=2943000 RepID=UPI00204351D7|nr:hypothetical protein [Pleomorphomonas sp. NRK KF1]MCM5552697.1 hypothetical protein [Pleomorphomonas sp. NRK KF1]
MKFSHVTDGNTSFHLIEEACQILEGEKSLKGTSMLFHVLFRWRVARPQRTRAHDDAAGLSAHLQRDIGLESDRPRSASSHFDCMSKPIWRMVWKAVSRLSA